MDERTGRLFLAPVGTEEMVEFHFSPELVRELQEVVAQFNKVFLEFAESVRVFWGAVSPSLIELMHLYGVYGEGEMEAAFKAYAREYNVRHPHRKLGWRRLNRRQRAEALGCPSTGSGCSGCSGREAVSGEW